MLTKAKLFFFFSIISLFACQSPKNGDNLSKEYPNIILIYTDDQGYGDIGYNGNPYIHTPVLDSLAENGVIFDNFYVAPVCAPSRASLLTGRYSIKTGVFDTWNGGAIMNPSEITMADIFQKHGFHTGVFGKWHLGDNYPSRAIDQGFDVSLIHKGGGIGQPGDPDNFYARDSSYFNPIVHRNGIPEQSNGYCSDVFTDGLIDFIDQNKESPFFAYLAFNAPHDPLQLPGEYHEMYKDLGEKFAAENNPEFMGEKLSDRAINAAERVYGMVTNIDDNIGRLVKQLNEKGIADKTMIIFISDNGPAQTRYISGLKGRKTSVYEGGIKVPAFVHYSQLKPARVKETLSHMDWLPTLLDYLNIEEETSQMDGKSFSSVLEGKDISNEFQDRPLYYHWHRGYPEFGDNTAIRKGDYKFVSNAWQGPDSIDLELFNIKQDPNEQKNLIEEEPEIAKALSEELKLWLSESLSNRNALGTMRYTIGSSEQEKVILTWNDAKGQPVPWTNDADYGFWDIEAAQSGKYQIKAIFKQPFDQKGNLVAKMGVFQKTVQVDKGASNEVIISDLFVEKGVYQMEVVFHKNWREILMPFVVEVEKMD